MKTLVTGANGHIGASLIRALIAGGRKVRVLLHLNRQAIEGLDVDRVEGDTCNLARTGLFRFISCPNYLGEIPIWIGWAIATWSPAGLSFAVWTMANLIPRARDHHNWYKQNFPDYPPERKALIPGLW